MAGLIARRLVAFAPTLLIVAIITFALEHIVPGGPALALVGACYYIGSRREVYR